LTGLVKAVDEKIAENAKLKAFVVTLTDDADKTADALKALAKDKGIKNVPLTVMESLAGPGAYRIAKEAEVTVLMWRGAEVKVNHAFAAGKLDDAAVAKVVADVSKILQD
jgi:precorrin-6B methylase 1